MTKGRLAVLIGFLIGAAVGNIGGIVVSGFVHGMKRAEVRRGWNGSSVMIAKRDLSVAETVDMRDVEERSLAASFINSSHLERDRFGSFSGQRLRVPVKTGQPLEASFFNIIVTLESVPLHDACVTAVGAKLRGAR